MNTLNNECFENYRSFIYDKTGIFISQGKKDLFNIKLNKAMAKINSKSYEELFQSLQRHHNEDYFQEFINTITTNTTEFFRERNHFDFITQSLKQILKNNQRIINNGEIRLWSAGCSTGEEPTTLAIVLKECLGESINIKILATDIDSNVLSKAMNGVYSPSECSNIPKEYINKYFNKTNGNYSVKDEVRSLISYRHFNLKNEFLFKNKFDMIFCRNVMIYFDREVQETLINRYYDHLVKGGLLFIGHSESLVNKKHNYNNIGPSIYIK